MKGTQSFDLLHANGSDHIKGALPPAITHLPHFASPHHINGHPFIAHRQRTSAVGSRFGPGMISFPHPVTLQPAWHLSFLWQLMGDSVVCGSTGVTPTFHCTSAHGLAQWFAGGQWIGSQSIPSACPPVKNPWLPNHFIIDGPHQH